MKLDDDTDQDTGDDESDGERKDSIESSLSSDIEDDDWNYQQEVLLLGQARRGKTLRTSRAPLPKKRSRTDTVTARPQLPHCRKLHWSIAPQLLTHQKYTLLNKSSDCDYAPSANVLPQPKSSGDLNTLQPKAIAD